MTTMLVFLRCVRVCVCGWGVCGCVGVCGSGMLICFVSALSSHEMGRLNYLLLLLLLLLSLESRVLLARFVVVSVTCFASPITDMGWKTETEGERERLGEGMGREVRKSEAKRKILNEQRWVREILLTCNLFSKVLLLATTSKSVPVFLYKVQSVSKLPVRYNTKQCNFITK